MGVEGHEQWCVYRPHFLRFLIPPRVTRVPHSPAKRKTITPVHQGKWITASLFLSRIQNGSKCVWFWGPNSGSN